MEEWHIPGLSVAVLADGELIWQRGLGLRSRLGEDKVDDRTVFQAASTTKPVFAYAVLKIHDEGLLDLDTPLIEYAPREYIEEKFLGHPIDAPGFRKEWFAAITARMALSHSSGLQHFGLKNPVEIRYEPGTRFYYSSNGIEYLRHVVEYVKGSTIDRVVSDYVLAPLKMEDSSLVWDDRYESNSAAGHDAYGETTGSIDRFLQPTAQASLYTNARDYSLFLLALLNGAGLRRETHDEMIRPQVEVDPGVYWGLGVGIETTPSGKGIWHWGDFGTFTAYFYGDLQNKSGFVFFANSHYGLAMLEQLFPLFTTSDDPHPALSFTINDWSFAEDYCSPAMAFKCRYMNGDVDQALAYYHDVSREHPEGKRVIRERQFLYWAHDFLRNDSYHDAVRILQLAVEAYHPDRAARSGALAERYATTDANDTAIEFFEEASATLGDDLLTWLVSIAVAELRPTVVDLATAKQCIGAYGPYEVSYSDGSLYLKPPGYSPLRMVPIEESTFALKTEGADFVRVRFDRGENDSAVLRIATKSGQAGSYERAD
jgi:CubicO group peptidase (beta-lactamase class C family)